MKIILQEGKMIRYVFATLAILIALSSCTPATQATPLPVISNSATPSSIPTATQTSLPTETSTASITPLPTIPTFTPTFDVSTIITVTPAPKAECPEISVEEYANALTSNTSTNLINLGIEDVTNDGIPEIIIGEAGDFSKIEIYVCNKGEYIPFFLAGSPRGLPLIVSIKDLNNNNIPEIVTEHDECLGTGRCVVVNVFEWNKDQFINLLQDIDNYGFRKNWGDLEITFMDVDVNGAIEILLQEGINQSFDTLFSGPWRAYIIIYTWNGNHFSPYYQDIAHPLYRFQAIQDADQWTNQQKFEKAITLYQDAIFNNHLMPWSQELRLNYRENLLASALTEPSPTPPNPDPSEYPRLAAYAYYRIILLHFVQGQESDAITTYNTLQEKFGNDQYSRPYFEMATAFWDAYQSTHKMYDGCAAAIQYAVEHPDILIPLGSDYHGWQSKIYKPEDVCPFR